MICTNELLVPLRTGLLPGNIVPSVLRIGALAVTSNGAATWACDARATASSVTATAIHRPVSRKFRNAQPAMTSIPRMNRFDGSGIAAVAPKAMLAIRDKSAAGTASNSASPNASPGGSVKTIDVP